MYRSSSRPTGAAAAAVAGPHRRGARLPGHLSLAGLLRLEALLIAAVMFGSPGQVYAGARFEAAFQLYQNGDYAAARPAFAELAELGQPRAQALYGQMLVKGQGGAVDLGAGFGWMQASAGNGLTESLSQLDKIKGNIAKLSPAQQSDAAEVLRRYRRAALEKVLLPIQQDLTPCERGTHVREFESVLADYPATARRWGSDAYVLIEVRVGVDGLAHEPHILAWFAEADMFSEPAMRAVMRSRFLPATRDAQPVEGIFRVRATFRIIGGGSLWDSAGVGKVAALAANGNAAAEYLIGSGGMTDPAAFHVTYPQALSFLLHSAQAGNPQGQYWIGDELRAMSVCEASLKAARWFEIAARNGEPSAQIVRARQLLASDPSAEVRAEARRLLLAVAASESVFGARQAIALLASSPFEDVRDPPTALSSIHGLKTGDYDPDPQTWEAVAAAYAANGRYAEALPNQERALKLAREYRWNTTAIAERLAAYRKNHAWTGDLFAVPPVAPPGPPPSDVPGCEARRRTALCLRIVHPAAAIQSN